MDCYPNYVSLSQRAEQREAQRRVKEAKRDEWVTAAKYFQSWERVTQLYDKWDPANLQSPIVNSDSASGCQCSCSQNQNTEIEVRRASLKTVLSSEAADLNAELSQQRQSMDRPLNGVTAHFVKQTDGGARPIPEKCDRFVNNYVQDYKHQEKPMVRRNGSSSGIGSLFGSSPSPHQNAKNYALKCRREKLRQLLKEEQEQYDKELRDGRIQASSGTTKNELSRKPSDEYSSRTAFLSRDVNHRKNEEMAHFSVFAPNNPPLPSASTTISTAQQATSKPFQQDQPILIPDPIEQVDSVSIIQPPKPDLSIRSSRSGSSANSIISSDTRNKKPPNRNHANSPKPGESVFRFW